MRYRVAKFIHLLFLVLWLGPSTGAWFLEVLAKSQKQTFFKFWIIREYVSFIGLQGVSLIILLSTGLFMRSKGGLSNAKWLKAKIAIVLLVLVPFQAAEAIIYSRVYMSMQEARGFVEAIAFYDQFNLIGAIVFAIFVPIVFLLAAAKPGEQRKIPSIQ